MITKLTKEQKTQIPNFIDKFVKLAEKPTNREEATLAVQELYKNAGEKKPIVIFGKSPYQTSVMVAMSKLLFKNKLIKDDSQLHSQLDSQLDSQLRSQLDSQLGSQLYSQLDSQLGSQLGSQLYSQLRSQLDSQLHSQLRSQLGSQLYSQLDSQLRSQLDSQLRSQLDSQLRSQLYSQLYSQLDSQLHSQLYSQLRSQLLKINNDWWIVIWWLVWACWYSFGEYIGVKFDKKILKIFMDFVTNVSFIIPYKGIAFVSESPSKIIWDNKLLHNLTKGAIQYDGGKENYYSIHGVKFTKEQFEKQKTASISDILGWEDIDQRSVLLQERPIETLLENIEKTLIDETEECGGYKLWEIDLPDIGKARIMTYKGWSSDKQYVKFVKPTSVKCLETIASLREITVKELKNAYKS